MRPAVGGKSPVTALKSVVLPAPLEPRIAYFCPAATVNDTSSTARSAPKARVTPSSRSASPESSCAPAPEAAPPRAAPGLSGVTVAMPSEVLRAAVGDVARSQAHLLELCLGQSQRLRDVGHLLHDLVVERAVGRLRHLGDVGGADAVAVGVDLDVAGRAFEVGLLQCLAVGLLAVRQVAL